MEEMFDKEKVTWYSNTYICLFYRFICSNTMDWIHQTHL